MSTLDIKKQSIYFLILSIIVLIFSLIYELFSHNVYSVFMEYSFVIPLLNSLILFIIYKLNKNINKISNVLFNLSVITLTIYSIVRGIFEIYGTTNSLINIYLVVVCLFIMLIIFSKIIHRKK